MIGNASGDLINNDTRIPMVSFTGSTRIGRHVSQTVAGRFGNTILELGGNNAIIVSEHSDLNMVLMGTVFGAVGTAGQALHLYPPPDRTRKRLRQNPGGIEKSL